MTTTKLKRLRAEKAHTDPPHYYNQTGREEETENGIYNEVKERTGHIQGLMQPYQGLKPDTLERREYVIKDTSAKARQAVTKEYMPHVNRNVGLSVERTLLYI